VPPIAAITNPPPTDQQIETITQLCADDLAHAFKLDRLKTLKPLIDAMCRAPSRRFARQIAGFDRLVADGGLAAGGRFILRLFAKRFTILGSEHVPASGPLLVVTNHPGMADAMALWVGLEARNDIKIIAAERELLRAVPNVSRSLLYVSPHTGGRTGMLRAATAHVRSGGALLTFPAGHIEPDPTVAAGACESLASWSPSLALFMRSAPDALVLPAAVGGVISGTAQQNPLMRLFRDRRERDWAAATLQILIPAYRDVHTRLAFGPPLRAADLIALDDPQLMIAAVTEQVAPLLEAVARDG
jgi:1-acyl-sn-glycerol-3-phosphate acyltransferase